MPAVLRGRGLAALTALLTSADPVSAAIATTKTALSTLGAQVGSVALTGWPCVPLPVKQLYLLHIKLTVTQRCAGVISCDDLDCPCRLPGDTQELT